ncbi:hypothetical protein [Cyclobacterium salsum]|nr:hypothetical protein [Cyclobacterium salsum]
MKPTMRRTALGDNQKYLPAGRFDIVPNQLRGRLSRLTVGDKL